MVARRAFVVLACVFALACVATATPKFKNGPGGDKEACKIAKQKLSDCRGNAESDGCSVEAEAEKNVCKCVDHPCWHFSNAGDGSVKRKPLKWPQVKPMEGVVMTPERMKKYLEQPAFSVDAKTAEAMSEKQEEDAKRKVEEAVPAKKAAPAVPATPLPEGKTDEERAMEQAEKQLKAQGRVIKKENRLPNKVLGPNNYLPTKASLKAFPLPKMNLKVPPLNAHEKNWVRLPTPPYTTAELKATKRKAELDRRNKMLANLEPDVVPESPWCHYCRESVRSQVGSLELLKWCVSQMQPDLCQHVVYSVDASFREYSKGKNLMDPVVLRQQSMKFSQHDDAVCKTFCKQARV